ncbi:8883_t:CDS:2 [Diversispora eburnea]|uniref:8883_t:CDS:1 n=1 Tax=Diversispora eburnea TaxID=1213867 RepID=A0A9N8YPH6_9GLOM|nr:8883_t:CDS:2 [Diversispora eburnea]
MNTDVLEILELCGEGTFSDVYKAKQRSTGTIVAIKKAREVKYERPAKERVTNEIKILKLVHHENEPVKILNSENVSQFNVKNIEINKNSLIFLFCPLTLRTLLDEYDLKLIEIKSCIWMILNGMTHIHNCGVMHRDLSPRNILINDIGVIKISDFGNAWINNGNNPSGENIGTRYYYAPELLFSAENYTNAIDLWSLGCIFAEFFTGGGPLFVGENDIEQLCKIFRVLGVPNEITWPEMKDFPDYGKLNFKITKCSGLNQQLSKANSPEIIQFISNFLKYPFKERKTAKQASQDLIFNSNDFSKIRIELEKLNRKLILNQENSNFTDTV